MDRQTDKRIDRYKYYSTPVYKDDRWMDRQTDRRTNRKISTPVYKDDRWMDRQTDRQTDSGILKKGANLSLGVIWIRICEQDIKKSNSRKREKIKRIWAYTVKPLITNTSKEYIKCRLGNFSMSYILYYVNFSICENK